MNKIFITLMASAAALFSANSLAQQTPKQKAAADAAVKGKTANPDSPSLNFNGFSLGLHVNQARASTELFTGSGGFDNDSQPRPGAEIKYNFALGSRFVLGLGLTASTPAYAGMIYPGEIYSIRERFAFDLEPGFAVSTNWLAFARVSTLQAKFIGSGTATDIQGTGYGLGVRTKLDRNWYTQASYNLQDYAPATTTAGTRFRARITEFSFGAGYIF